MEKLERIVPLEKLSAGIAGRLYLREMERVHENIMDDNTDPEAVREVHIIIRVTPDDTRESCGVVVRSKCKLEAGKGESTRLYLAKHRGRPVMVEHDPQQTQLQFDVEPGELKPAPEPES